MGMYDLLAAELGSDAEYLAQEPLFQSARQFSANTPSFAQAFQGREPSKWDAFLYPMAQGLISKILLSKAQDAAADEAYKDYRSSAILKQLEAEKGPANIGPIADGDAYGRIIESGETRTTGSPLADALLKGYQAEQRPEGWTAKQGKADMMAALLQRQEQEERQKISQALADKIAMIEAENRLKNSPEALAFKEKEAEYTARGKTKGEASAMLPDVGGPVDLAGIANVPKALQTQAVSEADNLAKDQKNRSYIRTVFKRATEIPSIKASFGGKLDKEGSELVGIGKTLIPAVKAMLNEPRLTDKDLAIMVEPFLPTAWDTKAQIEGKEANLLRWIDETRSYPVLDTYALRRQGDLAFVGRQGESSEGMSKASPPPGLPGESFEDYKKRVGAK